MENNAAEIYQSKNWKAALMMLGATGRSEDFKFFLADVVFGSREPLEKALEEMGTAAVNGGVSAQAIMARDEFRKLQLASEAQRWEAFRRMFGVEDEDE